MNAIRTRYHGPNSTGGSRFSATDGENATITVAYNYARNTEDTHRGAAQELMDAYGWTDDLIGAWHGEDMYWIRVPRPERNVQ